MHKRKAKRNAGWIQHQLNSRKKEKQENEVRKTHQRNVLGAKFHWSQREEIIGVDTRSKQRKEILEKTEWREKINEKWEKGNNGEDKGKWAKRFRFLNFKFKNGTIIIKTRRACKLDMGQINRLDSRRPNARIYLVQSTQKQLLFPSPFTTTLHLWNGGIRWVIIFTWRPQSNDDETSSQHLEIFKDYWSCLLSVRVFLYRQDNAIMTTFIESRPVQGQRQILGNMGPTSHVPRISEDDSLPKSLGGQPTFADLQAITPKFIPMNPHHHLSSKGMGASLLYKWFKALSSRDGNFALTQPDPPHSSISRPIEVTGQLQVT